MSDIGGPRRPLDLRPTGRLEAEQAASAPQTRPMPQPRPVAPAPRPAARPLAPRPVVRQQAAPVRPQAPQQRPAAPQLRQTASARPQPQSQPKQVASDKAARPAKSSTWKTVVQFVIGVVIIVLVAFSIVVLYVKYYAG